MSSVNKRTKRVRTNKKKIKKHNNSSFVGKSILSSFTHPGGSSPTHGNKIVKERFRIYGNSPTSSVTGSTVIVDIQNILISNLGNRCIAMADLFQYWRCTDFHFHGVTHPGNNANGILTPGNVTWISAVAFTPSSGYTAPTTFPQIVDFPYMHILNDHAPGHLRYHVPRKQLLDDMPYEWLKTTTTGVNDEDYTQFSVVTASRPYFSESNGGQMDYIWDFQIEFRGDIDPALLPTDKLFLCGRSKLGTPFEEFSEEKK